MVASASCREESWEGAEESEQGRRGGTSRARDGEGGVGGQPACWAANAASVLPLSAALCVVVIVLLLDVVTPLLLTKLKAWGDERGGGGQAGLRQSAATPPHVECKAAGRGRAPARLPAGKWWAEQQQRKPAARPLCDTKRRAGNPCRLADGHTRSWTHMHTHTHTHTRRHTHALARRTLSSSDQNTEEMEYWLICWIW